MNILENNNLQKFILKSLKSNYDFSYFVNYLKKNLRLGMMKYVINL